MDPKEQERLEREKEEKEFQRQLTQTRRIAMGLPPMDTPKKVPDRPATTRIPAVRPETTQISLRTPTQRIEAAKSNTGNWPGIPYSPGQTRRIAAALDEKKPKPQSIFAKPIVWVVLLLVVPAVVTILLYATSSSDTVADDRSAADIEKHLKKVDSSAPMETGSTSSDPMNPASSESKSTKTAADRPGYIRMRYSNGNVEMDLYRKEGYATPEKRRKKDDFLAPAIKTGESSDVDDRIPFEGKMMKSKPGDPE